MSSDEYLTIKARSTGDYRERGSKFLSYAYPCESEDELKSCIAALKKEHPSARHFCLGAVLRAENSVERSSDDGEPSGTAGLPILNQILSAELRNVVVIVVRYFGGTKLGKPGLIQAYKESTRLAIEAAKIIVQRVSGEITVEFDYGDTGAVMLAIERFEGAKIINQAFTARCLINVSVPKSTVSNAIHLFDHLPDVTARISD